MNRVTRLQALARIERAETSRVLVRRILKLDLTDLPRPGDRFVLTTTKQLVQIVALVEDDMEVRCRYVIAGEIGKSRLDGTVVGFTLSWLRKHAAPINTPEPENAA